METTTDALRTVSPLLAGYDLLEQYAILEHKYLLGIDMGFDPGLQCAVSSWESGYAVAWRQQRHQADCQAQLVKIEEHRWVLSERNGCEVSWEAAAHDWISRHAADWRRWRKDHGRL